MSIISHVSIGTNDYPRAKAFYDAVLGTLQIGCLIEATRWSSKANDAGSSPA